MSNSRRLNSAMLTAGCLMALLLFSSGCRERGGVKIGDPAPVISERDIHGSDVEMSRFKGKVVLLCFWADSCCGESLKQLETFYRRNRPRGLELLAIDRGDSRDAIQSYANRNGITFIMLADEQGRSASRYGVFGLPTMYIIDGSGIVREKILGAVPLEKLQKLVDRRFKARQEAEAEYEKIHSR